LSFGTGEGTELPRPHTKNVKIQTSTFEKKGKKKRRREKRKQDWEPRGIKGGGGGEKRGPIGMSLEEGGARKLWGKRKVWDVF